MKQNMAVYGMYELDWVKYNLGSNRASNFIRFEITTTVSYSNWTEWSIIQRVIARVISKSEDRKARGRFEIKGDVFWELLLSENVCSGFRKFWKL